MDIIEKTRRIYEQAMAEYQPYAVVAMVSGGNDSACAFHVAKAIGAKIDYVLHINTRTGIRQTTEFVREYYGSQGIEYLEADAGDAYEKYVMRKGFFGKGETAHRHAYHLLKAGPLRKTLSKHIRKGQRGKTILLLNGARGADESARRGRTKTAYCQPDPTQKKDVWCNLILDWKKEQRDQFLYDNNVPINPVTKAMCRSGECLCGKMQHMSVRSEASVLYPDWKRWIDDLEKRVLRSFPWGWGQDVPKWYTSMKRDGQADMFMPLCVGCSVQENTNDQG